MSNAQNNPVAKYDSNFVRFCSDIVVPIGGKFRRFGDTMDGTQRKLIEKLAPSVHAVTRGDVPPKKRFYVCASKGYGKDLIATLVLIFVLMFARRPTRAQLVANKQQQANEPLDIAKSIMWADGPLNRLASKVIELQNFRIVSHRATGRPESVVEVLTSDRHAHGSRPDILVCNEVSHIEDWQVFETAGDNLAKCPHGLGLYLSNAGHIGTPAHTFHESVLHDPLFDVTLINHPAPWIDKEVLAHKAKTDIPSRHQRYYYGVWSNLSGDVLPREQVARATCLDGPQNSTEWAYKYIAAADLSSTTNRSAMCVFAVSPDEPIKLAAAQSWVPSHYVDRSSFIHQLQADIRSLHRQFEFVLVGFDQYESFMLIDLCHGLGIPSYLYRASSTEFDDVRNNGTMKAEMLFRAFQEGWVQIFADEQLLLDLQATSIVTKAGSSKLIFGRDSEGGHADMADSFALGLLIALETRRCFRRNIINYGNAGGPLQEVLIA